MMQFVAVPASVQPEYARLLSTCLPSVIHSEEQNEEYIQQVAELLGRADSLTVAEEEFVKLLALLIENFEDRNYSLPKATPLDVLSFLMEQHGLKQKDLTAVFGSRSITSEVLNGKRELNKEQIRRLSERFNVSPELFFRSALVRQRAYVGQDGRQRLAERGKDRRRSAAAIPQQGGQGW